MPRLDLGILAPSSGWTNSLTGFLLDVRPNDEKFQLPLHLVLSGLFIYFEQLYKWTILQSDKKRGTLIHITE